MMRAAVLLLAIGISASAHTTFTLPSAGCPLAHCSIFAGNVDAQAPPTAPTQRHSDANTGSSVGWVA